MKLKATNPHSLFNVTSIVIKQLLNWILSKMECKCYSRQTTLKRIVKASHLSICIL